MKVVVQGITPARATPYSVGYDLHVAAETVIFAPFQFRWVSTNTRLAVPDNVQIEIRPRSSMGISQGWLVHYGTIDPDYFGEIKVGMMNLRPWFRRIGKGRRIAQAVFATYLNVEFVQGDIEGLNVHTVRSRYEHTGFGSSGK